jgi:hypothetical protein
MGFMHFLDGVSQLQTAPIFQTVNMTPFGGDQGFVALDHGGHLLALIWMHDENDFVVTHRNSLWAMAISVRVEYGKAEKTKPATGKSRGGLEEARNSIY